MLADVLEGVKMKNRKKFKKAKDIQTGIIGYGGGCNISRCHISGMQKAGMRLVAVAEVNPVRLKAAQKDFPGIETYSSAAAMLKSSPVDLVAVVTPHNTHADLARQCIKAGRNVVCEKPFAITTAECDALIEAARKKRVLISAYHNRHWDGSILQAVKMIKKGIIGEIVRIEAYMGAWAPPINTWRSSRSISGGIFYDWGIHVLEYGLQLINSDIVEVSGFTKKGFWSSQSVWKNDTNEDEGFVVVRFKNSAWLTLCVSSIDSNPKPNLLQITGTKGTYLMGHTTWEVINCTKTGITTSQKGNNPDGQWGRFYQNIADHLTKGTKLIISPEWARRPVHILDLAVQSACKGMALKAKYK
jgi:predicted dehydrogenase